MSRIPGWSRAASLAGALPRYAWCVYLVIALLKLWLVHSDEIIVRDYPFDDPWYVLSARRWYWLGSYTPWESFGRLPAYSLWLATTQLLGLPARISIELLFIAACYVWSTTAGRLMQQKAVGISLFAVLVFHPIALAQNRYIIADTFYAPVLLLGMAGLVHLWTRTVRRDILVGATGTGLALAVLWHTRQESILIVALLAVYSLLWFSLTRRQYGRRRAAARVGLAMLVIGGILIGTSVTVRAVNLWKFGMFVSAEDELPGLVAARKALLRIPPSVPRRFIPVPAEVRRTAYAVSPSFRELEPYIEGVAGRAWVAHGREKLGIDDEITTAWLWNALFDAAIRAGKHRSAREANAFYQQVANEINAACAAGTIGCRRVFSDRIDPDVSLYLPHLPQSFLRASHRFVAPVHIPRFIDSEGPVSADVRQAFETVTNRRIGLTRVYSQFSGWAFASSEPLAGVRIIDEERRVLAENPMQPRQDVSEYFARQGTSVPLETGFSISLAHGDPQPLSVAFVSRSGTVWAAPFDSVAVVAGARAVSGQTADRVVSYNTEMARSTADANRLSAVVQRVIAARYGAFVAILSGVAGVAFLFLLWRLHSAGRNRTEVALVTLLLFAVGSRVALFVLIDAASFPATVQRYLYPAALLLVSALIVTVHATAVD